MKQSVLSLGALALAAALGTAQAAGRAEVSYPGADDYTDAGYSSHGHGEREHTKEVLSGHFARLAARLPDGYLLRVTMKDIDLAGHIKWIDMRPIRVLGTLPDWPRLTFHYELLSNGQVLRTGDASFTDLGYLDRMPGHWASQPLPHEMALLDRWFAQDVASHVAQPQ